MNDFDKGDKTQIIVMRKGKSETLSMEITEHKKESFSMRSPSMHIFDYDDEGEHSYKLIAPNTNSEQFDDLKEQLDNLKQELKDLKKKMKIEKE